MIQNKILKNIILKYVNKKFRNPVKQRNFLIECINNQMKNLELLCENTTCNLIHKSYLKPYYQKSYKCEFYL